jgi:hypothetical protein
MSWNATTVRKPPLGLWEPVSASTEILSVGSVGSVGSVVGVVNKNAS